MNCLDESNPLTHAPEPDPEPIPLRQVMAEALDALFDDTPTPHPTNDEDTP